MNRKLRRDRNAFLVFLAAVPLTLLVALPLAVSNGNQYLAAKAQQQQLAAKAQQQPMQSGTGATQAPAKSASETDTSGK